MFDTNHTHAAEMSECTMKCMGKSMCMCKRMPRGWAFVSEEIDQQP